MFPFVVLVCIFNGMTSPFVFILVQIAPGWLPVALLGNLPVVVYLSTLAVSTLTLILGGIPAAMFERLTGRTTTDPASVGIWLVGVLVLSIPGIQNLLTGGTAIN